jgi:hypothetical protein
MPLSTGHCSWAMGAGGYAQYGQPDGKPVFYIRASWFTP